MTGHATDAELAGGWRAGLEVQACTCDDINFVCRESFQDPARTPGRTFHKVYCLHLRDSYESRIKKKVRAASPSTAAISKVKVFTAQDLPPNGHSTGMFL